MALRFLGRDLERMLVQHSRGDLMATAFGGIGFTDDGSTIYVHLFPRPGWRGPAEGRAFVLAWEDYAPDGTSRLACFRWLVEEARVSLAENVEKIVRWLDGK